MLCCFWVLCPQQKRERPLRPFWMCYYTVCVVNRPGAGSAHSPNLPRSKQLSPCEAETTERLQRSTNQEKILEFWITTKDFLVKCAKALRSVLLMLGIKTASQLHKTGPSYTSDIKQHYVIILSSKAFIGLWHRYIKFYWGHRMIITAWSQAYSHNSTSFKWLTLQNGLLLYVWFSYESSVTKHKTGGFQL